MKKIMYFIAIAIFTAVLFYSCSSSRPEDAMDLVNNLTKQGVSSAQAIVGLGALIMYAKGKLNEESYEKVSNSIPNLENVLNRAEELGAIEGPISSREGVEDSFMKLGMGKEKVNVFIPEFINFASQKGGPVVRDLLKGIF